VIKGNVLRLSVGTALIYVDIIFYVFNPCEILGEAYFFIDYDAAVVV
jgi:hypothetical protein